jgi:uncharacterized protein
MMVEQALIIFARLPREGEVKTRLGRSLGMDVAANIYREFAEHAFSLGGQLAAAGKRVYLFFDPLASKEEIGRWTGHAFVHLPQEGITLGERMQNAFDETFRRGSTCSVIIGTDVPELDVTTILQAYDLLIAQEIVVGPSTDGGYYLLGMNAPTKDLFRGVTYSTDTVCMQTLARAGELRLSVALLDALADIDTKEDYELYLQRKRNT